MTWFICDNRNKMIIQDQESNKEVIKNDKLTINVLLLLYILQGIPIGLGTSITLLLQNKNVTYKEQAMFSLLSWPYSMKLLWAPIVDSLYWKKMGRRKTWLISIQYILGFFMLFLSTFISTLFGKENESPNMFALTAAFFCLYFLCATQDIAVDGWALTMLSRQNVGFAAVCNSAGLRIGYFFGSALFLLLESPEFCNQYLRSVNEPNGLITVEGFLMTSGIIFLFTTTIILVFKTESDEKCLNILSLGDTYKQLYHIFCLKNVLMLVALLMTFQIAFATADSVSKLKFIEAGLHKETVALSEILMFPVEVLFPLYISRYTTSITPLNVFLKAFPYKLIFAVLFAILVGWTHNVQLESGAFPTYYYVVIVLSFTLNQVCSISLHVSMGSFFNRVSDPNIGATYMTLLNTFYNLGRNWASTLVLWLVDIFTFKNCKKSLYNCVENTSIVKCTDASHRCSVVYDGYYIETAACVIFGLLWIRCFSHVILKLQGSMLSEWKTIMYSQFLALESDLIEA